VKPNPDQLAIGQRAVPATKEFAEPFVAEVRAGIVAVIERHRAAGLDVTASRRRRYDETWFTEHFDPDVFRPQPYPEEPNDEKQT
jgi:hypothetical protein